jgi:hypothetical protein
VKENKNNNTISQTHFSISFISPKFFKACMILLDPLTIDITRNKNQFLNPLFSTVGRVSHSLERNPISSKYWYGLHACELLVPVSYHSRLESWLSRELR